MSERAKELWADFLRYLREAGAEWWDSVDDSPPSHVYTALFAVVLFQALKWWVG